MLQAIQTVFHLTMSRGDAVVIHTPCYPPFLDTLKEMGLDLIAVLAVRMRRDGGSTTTSSYRQLTSRAAAGRRGRAKALLLCNPHNPTGHVFTAAELRHVADIAQRHDLVLVSDEVHADLVHAPHRHVELAVVAPEVEVRTVTISSASKAFNVAGLRWACATWAPPRCVRRCATCQAICSACPTSSAWRRPAWRGPTPTPTTGSPRAWRTSGATGSA